MNTLGRSGIYEIVCKADGRTPEQIIEKTMICR